MSIYHYPYQRVLDVKSKEKEQAQLQMAKAIQRQTRVETRICELENKLDDANIQIEQQYHEGVRVQDLRRIEDYASILRKKLHVEKNEYQYAKKNVDKKQEVLLEKLKEEKTWSLLREKKEHEFNEQLKYAEQQEQNEIASKNFYRLSGTRGD